MPQKPQRARSQKGRTELPDPPPDLPDGAPVYFRNQFRAARATALRDAEGFQDILFALERLGIALTGEIATLGKYCSAITALANGSPLARAIPNQFKAWHMPFATLYQNVMTARNDALHQGAFARNLTTNAVNLALVLEDALMNGSGTVRDYLIRDVITAFPWQPISFIRQTMLENAFSTLPVHLNSGGWHIITDHAVARYVRLPRPPHVKRNHLLATTLAEAHQNGQIELTPACVCAPNTPIAEALQRSCQ